MRDRHTHTERETDRETHGERDTQIKREAQTHERTTNIETDTLKQKHTN